MQDKKKDSRAQDSPRATTLEGHRLETYVSPVVLTITPTQEVKSVC